MKWHDLFENNSPQIPQKGTDNVDIVSRVSTLSVRFQGVPSKILGQWYDLFKNNSPQTPKRDTDNVDILSRDLFIAGLNENKRLPNARGAK